MVFGHQLFLGFTWLRFVQKLILILLSKARCTVRPALLKAWHTAQVAADHAGDGLSLKGKES